MGDARAIRRQAGLAPFRALAQRGPLELGAATLTEAKRNVVATVTEAARRLGNTPAVCRKCYVHPAVLDCYLQGVMHETWDQLMKSVKAGDDPHALKVEEMAVLALLQARREAA